jgi:long-subunit acyl-CoA synthetase (AMP-forming)
MGEYVSLGKVESTLKLHDLVDTICVCARPSERSAVALVIPDQSQLERLAATLNNKAGLARADLCRDPDVVRAFLAEISSYGAKMKLEKFETPKALTLIPETW